MDYHPPLDPGIKAFVETLAGAGIETYESCQGGHNGAVLFHGHSYPEPTIRFHGSSADGFRALGIALQHQLPVRSLRRVWDVTDHEPVGPTWEMTFQRQAKAAP